METFVLAITIVIGVLLTLLNLFFWKRIKYLEKIFLHSDGGEGNDKLKSKVLAKDIKRLDKDIQDLYEVNSKMSTISRRGLSKVGFEKFNTFGETGGKKSFALAMLDFKDNGLVISTLQTEQGARLFIRPVKKGEGDDVTLTPEEKKALVKAKQVVFK